MKARGGAIGGRREVRFGGRFALLALVAAMLAIAAPGAANAQGGLLDPERNNNEKCASGGPQGDPRYQLDEQEAWSPLGVGIEPAGAGWVDASMHAMPPGSDCIRPAGSGHPQGSMSNPDRCSSTTCEFEVQTVCETHCGEHKHSPPFRWSVKLTATPSVGWAFVGWRGACIPVREVPRRDCVVQMAAERRAATAVFAAAPDTTPPALSPNVSVRALGSYNIEVSWTAASDPWLAGYDILLDGALHTRTRDAQPKRLIVKCDTAYTVQVAAFDYSGNETRTQTGTARTDSCPASAGGSTAPRPETAIHIQPRRVTKSRTAFFHFGTRGEIKATRGYQCKLNTGRWVRCNGTTGKRYRALRKGLHTFRVRAGNADGWDPTPAKWTWRIS